ncbi:biotin-dependent carboxyltransferase family protein [Algoriphagus sp.]|uniref:5-oxoprolinase subunit C family protein n=1 Tax=Algoriphagus sp. TaxID=1872435 RepID=UPI0032874AC7
MIRDIGYMTILKTAPGTSVQDQGRMEFGAFGVPRAGIMDQRSFDWVNHLLKNKKTAAVLEILQPGLKIQFDTPTLICLAGAKATVNLNGESIPSFGLVQIRADDLIEIGAFDKGAVFYIGIKNGFQTEQVMSSRSWFAGITNVGFANKGDQIPYFTTQEVPAFTASKVRYDFAWQSQKVIEVYPGPEWKLLDKKTQELIESEEFTISELKNRMAIQLLELLPNELPQMATAPVFPGTVQLTSGGKIIILMKDGQVTGGYPRILHLMDESLAILAQKNSRDKIRFKLKWLI